MTATIWPVSYYMAEVTHKQTDRQTDGQCSCRKPLQRGLYKFYNFSASAVVARVLFYLYLYPVRWHTLPSHASAEACLTGWLSAQPQGRD